MAATSVVKPVTANIKYKFDYIVIIKSFMNL